MKPAEICQLIQAHLRDDDCQLLENAYDPSIRVPASRVFAVMEFLKASQDLDFTVLMNQTASHHDTELRLYWHLYSYSQKHHLTVESAVPVDQPQVSSVVKLWPSADWLERETYDLFGIIFSGHPDLRRIMLPEDWEGFPLRKDYQIPDQYNDMDHRPSDLTLSFKPKGKTK